MGSRWVSDETPNRWDLQIVQSVGFGLSLDPGSGSGPSVGFGPKGFCADIVSVTDWFWRLLLVSAWSKTIWVFLENRPTERWRLLRKWILQEAENINILSATARCDVLRRWGRKLNQEHFLSSAASSAEGFYSRTSWNQQWTCSLVLKGSDRNIWTNQVSNAWLSWLGEEENVPVIIRSDFSVAKIWTEDGNVENQSESNILNSFLFSFICTCSSVL